MRAVESKVSALVLRSFRALNQETANVLKRTRDETLRASCFDPAMKGCQTFAESRVAWVMPHMLAEDLNDNLSGSLAYGGGPFCYLPSTQEEKPQYLEDILSALPLFTRLIG